MWCANDNDASPNFMASTDKRLHGSCKSKRSCSSFTVSSFQFGWKSILIVYQIIHIFYRCTIYSTVLLHVMRKLFDIRLYECNASCWMSDSSVQFEATKVAKKRNKRWINLSAINQCLSFDQSHFDSESFSILGFIYAKSFSTLNKTRYFVSPKCTTISQTGHCWTRKSSLFLCHFYLLSTVQRLYNCNRTTPLMTTNGANCFSFLRTLYTHTHGVFTFLLPIALFLSLCSLILFLWAVVMYIKRKEKRVMNQTCELSIYVILLYECRTM